MLKITRLSDLAPRELKANEVVGGVNKSDKKNLFKSKKLKNAKSGIQMHIGATGELIFLTLSIKEAFNKLRQAFTKTIILQHFDPKYYIWIKTDALGYTIGGVLS